MAFPLGVARLLGLPLAASNFYPTILGGVIFGIGIALISEVYGQIGGFRGLGLGKQLLEAVISKARTSNCQSLRWLVSNWNKEAMEFYHSIGASITNNEHHCELKLN